MTGPLDVLFAQVRGPLLPTADEVLGILRPDHRSDPTWPSRKQALAALSSIERHVQDMEKALRTIADGESPSFRKENHDWAERWERHEALALAALPAREKEEE